MSFNLAHNLQELKQTAAQNGKEGAREVVFSRLSNLLMAHAQDVTCDERALIDHMLLEVVAYVELSIRMRTAAALAKCEGLPKGIVNYLARDDIQVAKAMLMRSQDLNDVDLADIIEDTDTSHHIYVAQRETVSENISDLLIDTSEPDVVMTLIQNQGASLSPKSTAKLVFLSEKIDALRKPLLSRDELTVVQAQTMFWWVSSALRSDIMERYPVDQDVIDDALRAATEASVSEAFAVPQIMAALKLVGRASRERINAFMSDLRSEDGVGIVQSFAALLNVNLRTARQILEDMSGESFVIACKALSLDREQFTRLFLLLEGRRNKQARPTGQLSGITQTYDNVPEAHARHMLQLWDAQERLKTA